METNLWHTMWKNNKIGFHLNDTNKYLINNIKKLKLKNADRVFVPLCGKTHDIKWLLGLGYHVIGVELSQLAIRDLFADLQIEPSITQGAKLMHYHAPNIDIYVGDFFDLDKELLGHVDAVYDRASIVALPKDTRIRYTALLRELTQNAQQLVITLVYNQSLKKGPPFSVSDEDIQKYYQDFYTIALVEEEIDEGFKPLDVKEKVWHLY